MSGPQWRRVTALLIGLIGSSALVVGSVVGSLWTAPERVTGVLLAFASGTLVAALSFELFPEAVEVGGLAAAVVGLFSGATVFVVANTIVDSRVAAGAGDNDEQPASRSRPGEDSDMIGDAEAEQSDKLQQAAAGRGAMTSGLGIAFGLLAAVTLDGVPENLALGVSLEGAGGSLSGVVALLVAVFVSNLPESLVGSMAMRAGGRSRRFVISIWSATAAVLTVAVIVGNEAAAGMSPTVLAFALAFAGGAVLSSLADTLMPEAFEHGRPFNALSTAIGFLLAFVLANQ